MFPLVARINHSCRPNAQHSWHDRDGRETIHAVRSIKKGDELTLSYSHGGPSGARRNALKTYFGFDCHCELCSLPKGELKASDERLRQAAELDEAIGDPKIVKLQPEKALRDCHELLRIYDEEGVADLRLPRLLYDAFQITAMHSDEARASKFAQRCSEARAVCEGGESEEVQRLRALEKHPRTFENFAATKKWESKLSDLPEDLEAEKLESWLWRST